MDRYVQSVEVAVGTRSPFARTDFIVGDAMAGGELYLVRDGAQTPLRLAHFVQLRAARVMRTIRATFTTAR